MIDLHIHTTHSSDGQYSPEELFAMAASAGVRSLAFADHMTVAAAAEGLALAPGHDLEFFTGVELSTSLGAREYHLLCYGFHPGNATIGEFLAHYCPLIWEQALTILERLRGMGFDVTRDDIARWGSSVPSGVTFLDALRRRNSQDPRLHAYLFGDKMSSPYLSFYQDFSLTDFGSIISSVLPPLEETIRTFKDAGLLILAHPGLISRDVLATLKGCGLHGIEVYSSHHTKAQCEYLQGLARSLKLFTSAGSDFHGERIKPDIVFGDVSGEPDEAFLKALRGIAPAG